MTDSNNDRSKNKKGIEIIIGLVGRIGINLDHLIDVLNGYSIKYNYNFNVITISDLMMQLPLKKTDPPSEKKQLLEKIKLLKEQLLKSSPKNRMNNKMDLGTNLREYYKNSALFSMAAIKEIDSRRKTLNKSKNTIYVIRQLKRKEEVALLNSVYGNSFLQLSLFASEHQAKANLEKSLADDEIGNINQLIKRDYDESDDYGQHIKDCFESGHYFISETSNIPVRAQVKRMLDLLFCVTFTQPTYDEYFMAFANLSSLRSMNLSRQVGAAIVNKYQELISVGYNETQINGRPISVEYGDDIFFEHNKQYEYSSFKKHSITHKILDDIKDKKIELIKVDEDDFQKILDKVLDNVHEAIKKNIDFIEYFRATHAEMAAIIDAARRGHKVAGCTIYTNTHPCHLCIKHIIAAGIRKIIYLAPYSKDNSYEMFSDVLSKNEIEIESFIGVSPSRYNYVFDIRFQDRCKKLDSKDPNYCKKCETKVPNFDSSNIPRYIYDNWAECFEYKEKQVIELFNKILGGEELSEDNWAYYIY